MNNPHDGIVIVSMSNLFHIFDKERSVETKSFKFVKQTSSKLRKSFKPSNNLNTEAYNIFAAHNLSQSNPFL